MMEYYPGITNRRPKNPDYALFRERLATFKDWSTNGIAIEGLAKAGFYAAGNRDSVRCFFCGGGMKDWQRDDDPWIQHAAVIPYCEYLNLCVGEDFINMVQGMKEQDAQELTTEGLAEEHLIPDQLIEDLNCKASILLMDKGYRQEDVEQAIQRARETYGSGELRAHLICEFLLESNSVSSHKNTYSATASRFPSHTNVSNGHIQDPAPAPSVGLREVFAENLDARYTEQDRLLAENRNLKSRMTCKICMNKDACTVFIPCGHMVSCIECASRLRTCAVCRAKINKTVRAYPA